MLLTRGRVLGCIDKMRSDRDERLNNCEVDLNPSPRREGASRDSVKVGMSRLLLNVVLRCAIGVN